MQHIIEEDDEDEDDETAHVGEARRQPRKRHIGQDDEDDEDEDDETAHVGEARRQPRKRHIGQDDEDDEEIVAKRYRAERSPPNSGMYQTSWEVRN